MHPILQLRQLSGLEKDIVNILLRHDGPMTQSSIMKRLKTPASQATVSRAMKALIARDILQKNGDRRTSQFRITDQARLYAMSPRLRPPVLYDQSRIEAYEPNLSRWLPDDAAEHMHHAGQGGVGQLDASSYSRQIAERFLIDLSWASSRLEGNTYDFLNTEILLKYGQEAEGHDRSEAIMLLNHKRAIGRLLENIGQQFPDGNEVKRLHALMMNGLMDPFDFGSIRKGDVRISSSSYIPSTDFALLERGQALITQKAGEVTDPFEAAFFTLAATSYLQAFGDGNKRMGRLLSNVALLNEGLPPLSFIDIDHEGYLLGLIAFYEQNDTSLLGSVIADNYALTAPGYLEAISNQRIPHRLELRYSQRIQKFIHDYIRAGHPLQLLDEEVSTKFSDASEGDLSDLAEMIRERLQAITETHAVLYDLGEDDIRGWEP